MEEKTSSGISGLHFGHLKAEVQSTFISDFEATMAHILYASGYYLLDWYQYVNTMLEKKGKGEDLVMLDTEI